MGSLLLDSTDLATWASRLDARRLLPELIRRLVLASDDSVLRSPFPAGDAAETAGWDGIVAHEGRSAFIPNGLSGWELSTNADPKRKAEDDYRKRSASPLGLIPAEAVFVFVTPRKWPNKEEWASALRQEGPWRDVRVYDATDLEAWLASVPAVHIWASVQIGNRPEGVEDVETFWDSWSHATNPPLPPGLLLAGREGVAAELGQWLRDPRGAIALKGESVDEAIAFLGAVLCGTASDDRARQVARTVIVRDANSMDRLSLSTSELVIVPSFGDQDLVHRALKRGHHVLIPLGMPDSTSSTTLLLPRISSDAAIESLMTSGIPEAKAREFAVRARTSLQSLRRELAERPELHQPNWAKPAEGRALLPALLAGTWSDTAPGDREAIAQLGAIPSEEFTRVLLRWANESDPPVRSSGNVWYIASKSDAWALLSRYLSREDMARLEAVVLEVLGKKDPRFDLPADQRWMAGVLGDKPRHSELLRRGLCDTLALAGANGDVIPSGSDAPIGDHIRRVVGRLLKLANGQWQLWASIARFMPLLAEAAPDELLAAIEGGLQGQEPAIMRLFTDHDDVGFFDSSPHTGLLWALETLAWNPQYLPHATMLLAVLARLDPGGKLSNRPKKSLVDIFRLWRPQTAGTLDQRLAVIDTLRSREPHISWSLLRLLLPGGHDSAMNTSRPQWREWTPDPTPPVTRAELAKGLSEVASRMVEDVGRSGTRWRDLIGALPDLPRPEYEAAVNRLAEIDPASLARDDRLELWNALRELVSRHRSFPEAGWALPSDQINHLATLLQRFEPADVLGRFGWLFEQADPALPEGREQEYAAHAQEVGDRRKNAVSTLFTKGGLKAVRQFALEVKAPFQVGLALGGSSLAEGEEHPTLSSDLRMETGPAALFARGIVAGRVETRGREWAERQFNEHDWSSDQKGLLLAHTPCDSRTARLAESGGNEVDQAYWRLVHPFQWRGGAAEADVPVRKLLQHGRPYAAVTAIRASGEHRPPPSLIVEVLEAALARGGPGSDQTFTDIHYDIPALLRFLQDSGAVDESRLAAIEWGYLPLLRHEYSPVILEKELARNPKFFADLVSLVYRAEDEEAGEATEGEMARAHRAHDLLDSWRTPPGQGGGREMDDGALREWVDKARAALAASGRRAIGDQVIGQVLSGAVAGEDGIWPHPAVRELIDTIKSLDLEQGIEVGVYNSRGVVFKPVAGSGDSERRAADQYTAQAAVLAPRWPRTAQMLRRIADSHRADARREDRDAELHKDLGILQ
jgi:hypothetical protein